jgi:flagellar assembly protein FliH
LIRVERRAGQMAEFLKLFTEDFDAQPRPQVVIEAQEPEPDVVADARAAEHEAIREAAYRDGLRDGFQQAAAGHDATAGRVMMALEESLRAAQYQAAQEADRAATAVARLLIRFVMKMLPAACARYGAEEIADVARAVLPALQHEPHVVVAVHPEVAAMVEAELVRLSAGMQQRAVLAPSESVPPGDVRITWRDGSAARDTNDLMQRITAVFASHGLCDAADAVVN